MFLELSNQPRDYAWGSLTGIAEFIGYEPSGGPEAELWFGTHPGSPTQTPRAVPPADEHHATLTEWLEHHPELLGDDLAEHGRLPILLKVLAAAAPLSLQVHPTPEQARAGFADEERRGIPLSDPTRNYKDSSAKPEIIVAVSERFDALCGFRPQAEVAVIAEELRARARADSLDALEPLLDRLADPGDVERAFTWLLSGDPEVAAAVAQVVALAAEESETPAALYDESLATVRELAIAYPGDPGVVIAMLMNRVRLARGEALHTPAGRLHAYLSGVGLELMTTSDNVVRGGLTPKHIDTRELGALLSFEQARVPLLEPDHPAEGVGVYRPEAPFTLTFVEPAGRTVDVSLAGPSIVLVEGSAVTIADRQSGMTLPRGGAAFIDGRTSSVAVSGEGRLWIATALFG